MRFFARCLLLRKLFYRTPPARTTRQVGRAHMAYSLRVGSYSWAQFCKYYVFAPQPQPPYFARWTCLPACLGGEKFVARVTGAYPLGALNFQKNPRREPRRDPLPGDCNGTANGIVAAAVYSDADKYAPQAKVERTYHAVAGLATVGFALALFAAALKRRIEA